MGKPPLEQENLCLQVSYMLLMTYCYVAAQPHDCPSRRMCWELQEAEQTVELLRKTAAVQGQLVATCSTERRRLV